MISCTQASCREPARVGLRWTEHPMSGWTMTNERCFCNEHGDDAVAELQRRGISVTYTDFGMPVI